MNDYNRLKITKIKRIDLETAKLAKEKGFDNLTDGVWANFDNPEGTGEKSLHTSEGYLSNREFDKGLACTAPYQEELKKWLRDNHDLIVESTFATDLGRRLFERSHPDKESSNYKYTIIHVVDYEDEIFEHFADPDEMFDTYEDALEVGLQRALKII